jgi:hypothetical protein
MTVTAQQTLLVGILALVLVFSSVLLSGTSDNSITGYVAAISDADASEVPTLKLHGRENVLYTLGVLILALMVIYLIVLHRKAM